MRWQYANVTATVADCGSAYAKSPGALKASVAQLNKQITHAHFPCSVLLIPHFTLSFYFACAKSGQEHSH
jgi:hypothetical protein